MSCNRYILDDEGKPALEPDLEKWAHWYSCADRAVARTAVGPHVVSTVFLGFDHRFDGRGPPILFETMIYTPTRSGPEFDDEQIRYATRREALRGHNAIVREWQKKLAIWRSALGMA